MAFVTTPHDHYSVNGVDFTVTSDDDTSILEIFDPVTGETVAQLVMGDKFRTLLCNALDGKASLYLNNCPMDVSKKIQVIKLVRDIIGSALKDAKELTDSAAGGMVLVKMFDHRVDAERAFNRFVSAGVGDYVSIA